MRGTLSSREALSLLVKRKAGFRTFGSSFAGCRALPNPLARFQVAPVVARVSGRCSLVGGGSFRTSPFPRHRALCDGSVQSCFVRPCCHGFGRLARSPPGVRWSAAANAALSAATDCSAICLALIFAADATSTTRRKLALSVACLRFESAGCPVDASPVALACRSERCRVSATLHALRSWLLRGFASSCCHVNALPLFRFVRFACWNPRV